MRAALSPWPCFKDVQDRAMDIARENAESAWTFAGKISNAKTSQEIVTLRRSSLKTRCRLTSRRRRHFSA